MLHYRNLEAENYLKLKTPPAKNVQAYIAMFPIEVQQRLNAMRATIREAAPESQERISYGMPGYFENGAIVYFAAFKNHIGFYATPTGHEAFENELSAYKQGKGSVRFPHVKPLPLDLVRRITAFRLSENRKKTDKK